jgi:uncharacterized repeat protein (TIGR01451 family)
MKKSFLFIFTIGALLLLFNILHGSGKVAGGTNEILVSEEERNIEQIGPPWYDAAWHYRIPVTINNSAYIDRYQVLITLNSNNFMFDKANPDLSDLRLTDSDGMSPLIFWIEPRAISSPVAYVWVKVNRLAAGYTTVYIYYNNPTAAAISDGSSTFEAFDDRWCQFAGAGCTNSENTILHTPNQINTPFLWSTIGTPPSVSPVGSGILNLAVGSGIISTNPPYQYQAIGFKAMYGSGTGKKWGGFNIGGVGTGAMIGDPSLIQSKLYLINYNTAEEDVPMVTECGLDLHNEYHVFEVRWKLGLSEAVYDHGLTSASSANQVPITSLPVSFYNYSGTSAMLNVDWVYVRQYRDPEPIAAVGTPQGLVDLDITINDSPDPIRTGTELTYLLTVSNNSVRDAPGVVVTDTLPVTVSFVRASAALGCSHSSGIVRCNLNTIAANSASSATIVVIPTADGTILNTAKVDSKGYELYYDYLDNTSEQSTIVDSIRPTAEWIQPTTNGLIYTSYGNLVTLEISASDNDQVASVEFWWYDNVLSLYKTVFSPPYQTEFNVNQLKPGKDYFFEVRVYDRAGNTNFPDDRKYIYIRHVISAFLPILLK